MTAMTLQVLKELLSRPLDGDRADNRAAILAQAVGVFLSQDPRRREVVAFISAAEVAAKSAAALQSLDAEARIRLLAGVARGFQAARESSQATSGSAGARPVRARVLAALVAGPLTPSEIAKQVTSPQSVISRALKLLREEDAVRYTVREGLHDARWRVYELTPEGRRQLHRAGLAVELLPEDHDVPEDSQNLRQRRSTRSTRPDTAQRHALVQLARTLRRNERGTPEVAEALAACLDAPLEARDHAEILGELIVTHRTSEAPGAMQTAERYLDDLLSLSETAKDPLVTARANYELAKLLMAGGNHSLFDDPSEALEIAELAAGEVEDADATERIGWCRLAKAQVFQDRGRPSDAVVLARSAVSAFQVGNHSYGECVARIRLGQCLGEVREVAEARSEFSTALEKARHHEHKRQIADASFWLGELILDRAPSEASDRFRQATNTYRNLADDRWVALAASSEGTALLLHTNPAHHAVEEARTRLRHAVEALSDFPVTWRHLLAWRRLGVVEREAGYFDEATTMLTRAVHHYGRQRNPVGQAVSLTSLCMTYNAASRHDDAMKSALRVLRLVAKTDLGSAESTWHGRVHFRWCLDQFVEMVQTSEGLADIEQPLAEIRARFADVERVIPLGLAGELASLPRLPRAPG